MSREPDGFQPQSVDLSQGSVTQITTDDVDPRVVLDNSGVYVTNAAGGKEVAIDPGGVRLLASKNNPDAPTASRSVRWSRESNGAVVAQVSGGWYEANGGPAFANLWSLSSNNRKLAQVLAQSFEANDNATGVYVKTDTQVKKVISEDGTSDFIVKDPAGNSQYCNGVLRGAANGQGLFVGCRGGNAMSFDWNGNVVVWVDGTLVRNL